MGRAVYQTRSAAGISSDSHFEPPYSAAIPRKMRMTVEPIDFLEFALMVPPRESSGAKALLYLFGSVRRGG